MKNLIYLILFLISGCKYNSPNRPIQDLACDIEQKADFRNDTLIVSDLFTSPMHENSLWVVNNAGYLNELSLYDSSWKQLDKGFGQLLVNTTPQCIYKDLEDANLLWISNSRKGLVVYNIAKKSFKTCPQIRTIQAILFLKYFVFLGGREGLYRIERSTDKAVNVSQKQLDNVTSIEQIADDLLLINGHYTFNLANNKIEEEPPPLKTVISYRYENGFRLTSFVDNTIDIFRGKTHKEIYYPKGDLKNIAVDDSLLWLPAQNLRNGIIRYDYSKNIISKVPIGYQFIQYKVVNDQAYIWFYARRMVLIFNKQNYQTTMVQLDSDVKKIFVDSCYVYMNHGSNISVYAKNYIVSQSNPIDAESDEEIEYLYMVDSLNRVPITDFNDYYRQYKWIASYFKTSTNKRILNELQQLKENVARRIPYDFNQLLITEKLLADVIEEEDLKAMIYMQIVELANQQAKLSEALHFDSILLAHYPEYRDQGYITKMEQVAKSDSLIKQLNTRQLPEDAYLWELGNIYYNLFIYVGPVTEASTVNMNYPFQFFNELLKKYPESEYADNAAYIIFSGIVGDSHEGGDNSYNLEAVKQYKKLLKKYPNTELRPNIYLNLVQMYIEPDCPYTEQVQYFRLAVQYTEKIKDEFPIFYKTSNVAYYLNLAKTNLQAAIWEFEINSDKTTYYTGDSIMITFSLLNRDNKMNSLKVIENPNCPNFIIRLFKYPLNNQSSKWERVQIVREEGRFNKNSRDTVIDARNYFRETWDITKFARDDFSKGAGAIIFNGAGRYKISAYGSVDTFDLSFPSNDLWITILEKEDE